MSQRKAKQGRRAARESQPQPSKQPARRRWLWLAAAVVVAAVVVGGVFAARGNGPAPVVPASGDYAAPLVHLAGGGLQLAGTDPVTGQHVSLGSYAGKPIVLNVWGSWCTGCRAEARDRATFVRTHPNAQTIGVDTQDTSSGARAFYREFGWHHPSIADPNGRIAARLGLQGTPTTFFLDRQHHVVARIIGATNLAGFEQGLKAALRHA